MLFNVLKTEFAKLFNRREFYMVLAIEVMFITIFLF